MFLSGAVLGWRRRPTRKGGLCEPDGLCDRTACVLAVVLVAVLAVVLADVLVFKEGVKKHYVLCSKLSNTTVVGKSLRKTAARTLLF